MVAAEKSVHPTGKFPGNARLQWSRGCLFHKNLACCVSAAFDVESCRRILHTDTLQVLVDGRSVFGSLDEAHAAQIGVLAEDDAV